MHKTTYPSSSGTPAVREKAGDRRSRELHELKLQGLPVVCISKWLFRVGPLCIWPYSGRWLNVITENRGRLNSITMRDLLRREIGDFGQLRTETLNSDAQKTEIVRKLEEAYLQALKEFIQEAGRLTYMLDRFKLDKPNTVDYWALRDQKYRENWAYAAYRLARERLLTARRRINNPDRSISL